MQSVMPSGKRKRDLLLLTNPHHWTFSIIPCLNLATINKPLFRSAHWWSTSITLAFTILDSTASTSHYYLAECLKRSQPSAPCFPSRHSFLPGAPLEEGGSFSDRTTQTASWPWPDAFLKTESGRSIASTICPFISNISIVSCALSSLGLLVIDCVQTTSVFQETLQQILGHKWWGWRRQCVCKMSHVTIAIFCDNSLTATISISKGSSVTFTHIEFCLTPMASLQFRWVFLWSWVFISLFQAHPMRLHHFYECKWKTKTRWHLINGNSDKTNHS